MRTSAIAVVLLLACARPASAQSDNKMPTMRLVEPESARAGEVVVAQGANLGPEYVAALYLTDGKIDTKVTIVEQTATAIRFRIPPQTKPGRLALMVLTTGREPKYIEEPVKITIEPGNTTSRLGGGSAGKVALCLTVWTKKIRHDDALEVTPKERIVKWTVIVVLSVLLFGGVYLAVHMIG